MTGCAGFIGSHLTEALLADGHEVVGVDSFTDFYARHLKEANIAELAANDRFSLVEADMSETALEPLLEGVAGVFHLAAQAGVRGSWGSSFNVYLRDNELATQRLFEAAAGRAARVVFASSSSVYGDASTLPIAEETPLRPISPYAVTKLGCEQLAVAYAELGLDVVSLRYFTVYGPRQRPDMAFSRIVRAVIEGEAFRVFGSGEQSRDFTFVTDAVAATRAAMDRAPAGQVYNVGGGREASLREVISLCEQLTGRPLEVHHEGRAAGDVRRTAAETSRIRTELGWRPETSLEAGLEAQIEAVRIGARSH